MTRSPEQRLDRIEDEFEEVKELLSSAAKKIDQLGEKQDRTQSQIDQLSSKIDDLTTSQSQTESRLDEFIFQAQRLITQQAERMIRVEGQADRLEALLLRLDRNHEAEKAQFLAFQQTTTAALDRIDRVLDYLLKERGGRG